MGLKQHFFLVLESGAVTFMSVNPLALKTIQFKQNLNLNNLNFTEKNVFRPVVKCKNKNNGRYGCKRTERL